MGRHAEAHARPPALVSDADAAHPVCRGGWEVDVVKQPEPRPVGPVAKIQQPADRAGAVDAGGLERIGKPLGARPEILRQRDRGQALKRRFHRAADGARIHDVLARVVAAVHARQDEVGGRVLQDVRHPRHDAVGGAALGRPAPGPEFRDHGGVGVADAVGDARLLERGRDHPDLTAGARDLGRDRLHRGKAGGVDAVVVGDEYPHPPARSRRPFQPPVPATRSARPGAYPGPGRRPCADLSRRMEGPLSARPA